MKTAIEMPQIAATNALGSDFETLLSMRQATRDKIKEMQSAIAMYDVGIAAYLDTNKLEKTSWVNGEDIYVVYKRAGSKPRRTIDPNKLLQHDVPASVIEECTVYGKAGKPGIGVRKVGEPENDDTN